MVKALLDTNILIDYLNGFPQAFEELNRYREKYISIITWMEVMVGAKPDVAVATRGFLESFQLVAIDETVAERAVSLRQQYRIRLPDAVVWASADAHSMILITRNTRDFPADDPGVRIPYDL